MNKIFEIEAEIAGVAGSYAQNRQRRYQEFYIEDWTTACLLLVLRLRTDKGSEPFNKLADVVLSF